jgi:hypothetical protein
MNTDHINYQQHITQSVNEEKVHELLETTEDAPKQHISSSISTGSNQNSDNNMTILTPIQRRERIFTLLIIALISLLTGKNKIVC